MAPIKKYQVTIRVEKTFLETLPVFEAPKPKSRVKKISAEVKKNAASPKPSPVPSDDSLVGKIITGPKELSTAGLTVNSANQPLDKSGKPCRKWAKSGFEFKTFSGFKVHLEMWKRGGAQGGLKSENVAISNVSVAGNADVTAGTHVAVST